MGKVLFDIEKINLIIKLAKPIIEKSGSYKIINNMSAAEEVELRKHFNMEFLYQVSDKNVYLLKAL